MEEDILDYDETKRRPDKLLSAVFIVSITLFFYWFLSGYVGFPYGEIALFTGLILLFLVTVFRFFSKRGRSAFEYFYFIGKLALFAAIFMVLSNIPGGFYLTWAAFFMFAIGLVILSFKKK